MIRKGKDRQVVLLGNLRLMLLTLSSGGPLAQATHTQKGIGLLIISLINLPITGLHLLNTVMFIINTLNLPFGVLEPPKHMSMPFRLHLLLIHDLHRIEHHVYLQTWGCLSIVLLKSFWLPKKSHHYLLSSCQILCLQTLGSTNIVLTTNPLGI